MRSSDCHLLRPIAVSEHLAGNLIFLHQVHAEGTNRSYGREAVRLASDQIPVMQRACQVVIQIAAYS